MTQCQPLLHALVVVAWLAARDTVALRLVARGSNTAARVVAAEGDTGVFRSSPSSACGSVPLACAPNCAAAIRDALTKCSAAGGGTVVLAPGLYHLNDSAVAELQPMIVLSGLANVALVGQPGAGRYDSMQPDPTATTLLVHGLQGTFALSDSNNIRLQGIHVDMARQPYTYGQCTAVGNGSFTIHFDAAMYPFAPPIPDYLLKVESVMGFDPATWCVGSNFTLKS